MRIVTKDGKDKDSRAMVIEYDFGADLDESQAKYEPKLIHEIFVAKAKILLQDFIRRAMKAGKTDDEIVPMIEAWAPDYKAPRGKSPLEKATALINDMTAEELAEFRRLLND